MSIFLTKFTRHAVYAAAESSLAEPNVSYCTQENEVHYKPFVPPIDYSTQYLEFIADGDITYQVSKPGISYSLDDGDTWTSLEANTATPTIHAGENILWKGTITPSSTVIGTFSSTGNNTFTVQGNPMSLLYGDEFKNQLDLTGKDYAFYFLFKDCTKLISAENLSLPATTLAQNCYSYMFSRCTSLTTAPELPATTLSNNCYQSMFHGCTGLTTAPELPATTLAQNCYSYMFDGCTGLTTAPELPATTLANNCYQVMFNGCTSLTSAPVLPATTLADYCYDSMFYGCSSLTSAPVLPATTLAKSCYQYMFQSCTGLTAAPVLPAIKLASSCYSHMFNGCSGINYIKCLATINITTTNCSYWVDGVASSGTFVKSQYATWKTTGTSAIPSGWTVEDA